jgi:integrase
MACVTRKKRYPGRWCIDFYDQDGKRRLKVLKDGTTKKQAKNLLRDMEDQIGKGTWLPAKKIPTFSQVAQDWIEHKKSYLRQTSWDCYEGHTRKHFKDFADQKITDLTTAIMEKWIRDRQEEGMHILTLRKVLVTLNQIMKYAVRHRYVDYNPLTNAERPRRRGRVEDAEEKIRVLSRKQIRGLLANTEHRMFRVMFRLAIFSGVRQGELIGLKWSDIDWKNSQIFVQRTYTKGQFFATKTKKSRRKIDIGPEMVREIKKWRLACPSNKLDLLFPNDAGEPVNYSNMMQRHYFPALAATCAPLIRFHDLRHTYASIQLDRGMSVKYVQSQLGHSSPTVTWNVYAHRMKKVNQEAACGLENDILGDNGDKMETELQKAENGDTVNG